jgi:hypothetical protein
MHKMASHLKAQLFGVGLASIGNANAGLLFDCIGSILGVAGSTAQGWFKEYRDFHGLKRHRRPAKVASPQTS